MQAIDPTTPRPNDHPRITFSHQLKILFQIFKAVVSQLHSLTADGMGGFDTRRNDIFNIFISMALTTGNAQR